MLQMSTDSSKLIYYYQTFSSLAPLAPLDNVVVYVCSLHFGQDPDTQAPYIHLNNHPPDTFTDLWPDLEVASQSGIRIMTMLGGAGTAYGVLFSDFATYYKLLHTFLQNYPVIRGIDLDVEETVSLTDIKRLIQRLHDDFGESFTITMAPLAGSLIRDSPGMGGFSYKHLIESPEGKSISWFNVQCYGCYTEDTYMKMVENGYRPDQLVMTMLGDEFTKQTLGKAVTEIKGVTLSYPTMAGCCLWEYGDTTVPPILWGKELEAILCER